MNYDANLWDFRPVIFLEVLWFAILAPCSTLSHNLSWSWIILMMDSLKLGYKVTPYPYYSRSKLTYFKPSMSLMISWGYFSFMTHEKVNYRSLVHNKWLKKCTIHDCYNCTTLSLHFINISIFHRSRMYIFLHFICRSLNFLPEASAELLRSSLSLK